MTTFTEEEKAKLPKWAREKIADLERETHRARANQQAAEDALAGDGEGAFGLERGLADGTLWLPKGRGISWRTPKGFDGSIRVDGEIVRVMGTSSYHRGLVVQPQATNVVEILGRRA